MAKLANQLANHFVHVIFPEPKTWCPGCCLAFTLVLAPGSQRPGATWNAAQLEGEGAGSACCVEIGETSQLPQIATFQNTSTMMMSSWQMLAANLNLFWTLGWFECFWFWLCSHIWRLLHVLIALPYNKMIPYEILGEMTTQKCQTWWHNKTSDFN